MYVIFFISVNGIRKTVEPNSMGLTFLVWAKEFKSIQIFVLFNTINTYKKNDIHLTMNRIDV
jgi:hypothetical protein